LESIVNEFEFAEHLLSPKELIHEDRCTPTRIKGNAKYDAVGYITSDIVPRGLFCWPPPEQNANEQERLPEGTKHPTVRD